MELDLDGPSGQHKSLIQPKTHTQRALASAPVTRPPRREANATLPDPYARIAHTPARPDTPGDIGKRMAPDGWARAATFVKAGRARLGALIAPKPEVEVRPLLPWAAEVAGPAAGKAVPAATRQQDPASFQSGAKGVDEAAGILRERLSPQQQTLFPELTLEMLRPTHGGCNESYFVRDPEGREGVFKPQAGEVTGIRPSVPNHTEAFREMATSALDGLLGFELVPPTRGVTEATRGPGSLMNKVEGKRSRPVHRYPQLDRERMAVLDYIAANTDRHDDNWLTTEGGRPAAIDNGLAFPTGDSFPIRSEWVVEMVGKQISQEVLAQVRSVTPERLRATLEANMIEPVAIDGALARLQEVQGGRITLDAWKGGFFAGWDLSGPQVDDYDFDAKGWMLRRGQGSSRSY